MSDELNDDVSSLWGGTPRPADQLSGGKENDNER